MSIRNTLAWMATLIAVVAAMIVLCGMAGGFVYAAAAIFTPFQLGAAVAAVLFAVSMALLWLELRG